MLKRWLKVALIAVVISCVLFAASFLFPAAYQICAPNEYTHIKECPEYHLGPFVIFWTISVLDAHNGLVTALATIFIAGFTATLYLVTGKAVNLANAEFNATHRPKLFVHTLTVTDKGRRRSRYAATLPESEQESAAAKPVKGIITVANGGDSVAFIIEWQSVVYYQASDAAFTPHLDIADVQRPKPDAPGISPGVFMPIGHSQVHPIDQEWQWFVEGIGHRMFFIGRITYEGPDKIRRSVGFCREWDKTNEGRWKPTNYSEYEYSY